ncbi:MAG TPA: phosphodiester glycosidase family protein [Candidatus Binatia bacterium]|jgi:uncharacterized protein YigE (DUF2233 family)
MRRRKVAPIALLLLLALTCRVWPQAAQRPLKLKSSPGLAVTESGTWKVFFQGAEFRRISLERNDPYQAMQLKIVRFDSRWIEPRVVHSAEYRLTSASVKTLAEKSGALAIINANYFDERHMALGFFKTGSEKNATISKSPLFTGIFAIKDRIPFIMHRDQFDPEQADQALQAGPLLLAKGSPLTVTRGADKQFRRSVIGIDAARRLVIAVTDNLFGGLTWTELQELFGAPEWRIETPDLMNLDGGGSTQLQVKTASFEEYVPGTAEVPVAIGFFPKSH